MKLKTLLQKHIRPCQGTADENLAKFSSVGLKLCAVVLSVAASHLLFTHTSSAQSSITLTTTPSEIKLEPVVGANGIVYSSHKLGISTTAVSSYSVTIKAEGSSNLTNQDKSNATPILPVGGSQPGNNLVLGTNQWGYVLGSNIPGGTVTEGNKASAIWSSPTTAETKIIDKTLPTGAVDEDANVDIYYGANVDTNTLTKGLYQAKVTYTATATPARCQTPLNTYSNDANVVVDLDSNMIPIGYYGDENDPCWKVVDPTDKWFNYEHKYWANAVTITKEALNSNKYINPDGSYKVGVELDEDDVLGYWVYIPRYAYEVMRPNAIDKVVTDTQAISEGGFKIKLETKDTIKKVPHETCSTSTEAKDYRTDCVDELGISRDYPDNVVGSSDIDKQYHVNSDTAWATHPAFSWCTTPDYEDARKTTGCTELNGFWMGKFETTGSIENPTIKPGITSLRRQSIGKMFASAKYIGKNGGNVEGGQDIPGHGDNTHNLSMAESHMLKNSEWGAATYLSASKYGAGVDGVEYNYSRGYYTGGGSKNTYIDKANQSTANNVTGVYDMAGGSLELVMGGVSTSMAQVMNSSSSYYGSAMKLPYADLYPTSVFTNDSVIRNFEQCTWLLCGGHALHETRNLQFTSNDNYQSWGNSRSLFVDSNDPWFARGGDFFTGGKVFSSDYKDGDVGANSFRIVLIRTDAQTSD